jgi:hypothetical protein
LLGGLRAVLTEGVDGPLPLLVLRTFVILSLEAGETDERSFADDRGCVTGLRDAGHALVRVLVGGESARRPAE